MKSIIPSNSGSTAEPYVGFPAVPDLQPFPRQTPIQQQVDAMEDLPSSPSKQMSFQWPSAIFPHRQQVDATEAVCIATVSLDLGNGIVIPSRQRTVSICDSLSSTEVLDCDDDDGESSTGKMRSRKSEHWQDAGCMVDDMMSKLDGLLQMASAQLDRRASAVGKTSITGEALARRSTMCQTRSMSVADFVASRGTTPRGEASMMMGSTDSVRVCEFMDHFLADLTALNDSEDVVDLDEIQQKLTLEVQAAQEARDEVAALRVLLLQRDTEAADLRAQLTETLAEYDKLTDECDKIRTAQYEWSSNITSTHERRLERQQEELEATCSQMNQFAARYGSQQVESVFARLQNAVDSGSSSEPLAAFGSRTVDADIPEASITSSLSLSDTFLGAISGPVEPKGLQWPLPGEICAPDNAFSKVTLPPGNPAGGITPPYRRKTCTVAPQRSRSVEIGIPVVGRPAIPSTVWSASTIVSREVTPAVAASDVRRSLGTQCTATVATLEIRAPSPAAHSPPVRSGNPPVAPRTPLMVPRTVMPPSAKGSMRDISSRRRLSPARVSFPGQSHGQHAQMLQHALSEIPSRLRHQRHVNAPEGIQTSPQSIDVVASQSTTGNGSNRMAATSGWQWKLQWTLVQDDCSVKCLLEI